MATAHATLSNFRQAPRKMRMVANVVRGKKVADVLTNLDFTAKKASLPIKNLILSALANAKTLNIPTENLVVKIIKVDSGKILYRRRPAARGSAHPIRKRTSAIFIELGEPTVSTKKVKIIKESVKEKVVRPKTIRVKAKATTGIK
ncbi:MAG: 50S ribosomal protein L22 [Candidatus Zambryskibacteria bacterium]|nr:50S ribosomal protein L22 [Candidatus Zambryskibacteria bacterium]